MSDKSSKQETLLTALRYLMRHYVGQLENARERIVFLGGECDSVETMERRDPHLRHVREVIAEVKATPDETAEQPKPRAETAADRAFRNMGEQRGEWDARNPEKEPHCATCSCFAETAAIYGTLTARDPQDVTQELWTRTGLWRPSVKASDDAS